MERKRILIAVNTPPDVEKLRKFLVTSGYEIKVVDNGVAALTVCRDFQPHLILSELNLAQIDGHHLLREIKANASTNSVAFMMMSRHRSVDERVHTMSLGVDDYITVPFDIREVMSRIELLLEELEKAESWPKRNSRGFSGNLSDMNTLDILQALGIGQKTGVLSLTNGEDEGLVYIRNGDVLDAKLGSLPSLQALLRMFTWSEGHFRFELEEVEVSDQLEVPTDQLISQGRIYKDRWDSLCRNLPPLQTPVTKIQPDLVHSGSEDEKSMLGIVNGNSRMLDLVKNSRLDDLKALKIVTRLFTQGVLKESPAKEPAASENGKNVCQSNSPGSRITRLVDSFLNLEKRQNGLEKLRTGSVDIDNQIHLNKSELLMIRAALSNKDEC